MLRAWTELSELLDPKRVGPVKKYSLDAALLKALQGMDLPLELPKDTVERIKKGEKVVISEIETGRRKPHR